MDYGTTITTTLSFDEAVQRARAAVADQGFGVLTEIDVQASMKKKLDKDLEAHPILGACNDLAFRALQADPGTGLFLSCSVVVRREGDSTLVPALDPPVTVSQPGEPERQGVPEDAGRRPRAAVDALATA